MLREPFITLCLLSLGACGTTKKVPPENCVPYYVTREIEPGKPETVIEFECVRSDGTSAQRSAVQMEGFVCFPGDQLDKLIKR